MLSQKFLFFDTRVAGSAKVIAGSEKSIRLQQGLEDISFFILYI